MIAAIKGYRTNRLKVVLRTAIGIFLGLLVIIFVRYRLSTQNIEKPSPPDESRATLSINRFNHTAMKDGKKHWVLKAESAQVFSEKNVVRLKQLNVTYFMDNGTPVTMTADKGRLNMDSKNIAANGNIVVEHPRYTMETQNLQYHHDSHIIRLNKRVVVSGEKATLEADSAKYEINAATVTFQGHVEGWFSAIAGI